jgi:Tfp pilus assembly protein PilE
MKGKILKINKGYSMVELLFYISIFFVLTLVIINSLVVMTRAFRVTSVEADLVQSSTIIEKISREIRQAYGINSIGASDLKLNTKDELDNNKTVRFVFTTTDVLFYENDVLTGNLNSPNIQISALSFTEITTVVGKAVKIILSLNSTRGGVSRTEDFYDTVVLRGGY